MLKQLIFKTENKLEITSSTKLSQIVTGSTSLLYSLYYTLAYGIYFNSLVIFAIDVNLTNGCVEEIMFHR